MTLLERQVAACVARAQIERIKKHWQAFWFELRDFHASEGWRGLFYTSFKECVEVELGISEVHAYRILEAANIREELSTNPGVSIDRATERQLRELKPLEAEQRAEVARNIDFANTSVREVREIVQSVIAPDKPHVSFNSGNNEWYTPPEYIVAARHVLFQIDLDPASSAIANKIVGASAYFTAADDGLAHDWRGRVWLNPPYASELIGRFADKLVRHIKADDVVEAIVLVNNATETNWFQVLLYHATAVCFPKQRVKFLDPEGKPGAPLQGQAVFYFGSEVQMFRDAFRQFGGILYG